MSKTTGTRSLEDLFEELEKEVVEVHTSLRPLKWNERLWSVQIFPSDTGVCYAEGRTIHEAGWKALKQLEMKRL